MITPKEYQAIRDKQRNIFQNLNLFPMDSRTKSEQFILGLLFFAPPIELNDLKRIISLFTSVKGVMKTINDLESRKYIYMKKFREMSFVTLGVGARKYIYQNRTDSAWIKPKINDQSIQSYLLQSAIITKELISAVSEKLYKSLKSLSQHEQDNYFYGLYVRHTLYIPFIYADRAQKEEILSSIPNSELKTKHLSLTRYIDKLADEFIELISPIREAIEATESYKTYRHKVREYLDERKAQTMESIELLRELNVPANEILNCLIDVISPPKNGCLMFGNAYFYKSLYKDKNKTVKTMWEYDNYLNIKSVYGAVQQELSSRAKQGDNEAADAYIAYENAIKGLEFIKVNLENEQLTTLRILKYNNVIIRSIRDNTVIFDILDNLLMMDVATLRKRFSYIGQFCTALGLMPQIFIRTADRDKKQMLKTRAEKAFTLAMTDNGCTSLNWPNVFNSKKNIKVNETKKYLPHAQALTEIFKAWNIH